MEAIMSLTAALGCFHSYIYIGVNNVGWRPIIGINMFFSQLSLFFIYYYLVRKGQILSRERE